MNSRKPLPVSLFAAMLVLLLPLHVARAAPGQNDNLKQQVDLLQAQMTTLQTQVTALQSQNSVLQTQVNELQTQSATLTAITPYMSLQTVNDHPTVRFSGVNVQVVNGMGGTGTVNGTGNLIVGYDEPSPSLVPQCTIGTVPTTLMPVFDEATCTDIGGSWLLGFKTGSHYLVVGYGNNYSRWGGLVVGFNNTSNNTFASVSGGAANAASGASSSVSGGVGNKATGPNSSVSGGAGNFARALYSSVSGGTNNGATGQYGSVSGGTNNRASGESSSVSGGLANNASGAQSSVSGGGANNASGVQSSVSGGASNAASGTDSSVLGGNGQSATGLLQTIPPIP